MIWALRGAFILQALLGLGLSRGLLGMRPLGVPSGEGDMHMLVGIVAAVLALVVIKPTEEDGIAGQLARYFPMAPLALGLLIRFAGMGGLEIVVVHIVLGIVAVGLIEATLGRRRRRAAASRI